MVDGLDRIIFDIKNSEKLSLKRNGASQIYSDEPLIFRASEMKDTMPYKYREMQSIAFKRQSDGIGKAELFLEQGNFMAEYEDDFKECVPFVCMLPTYISMNTRQLRSYFSWRTRVRKGAVEAVPFSYAYVYIYELINLIGVNTPEDAFAMLYEFYESYRPIMPFLSKNVPSWLFDMVIYYGLDSSFLGFLGYRTGKSNANILTDIASYSPSEVTCAVNSLLNGKISNSIFYQRYKDELEEVLYEALLILSNEEPELFVCTYSSDNYVVFQNAVFYDTKCYENYSYDVSDTKRIRCKNFSWSVERFISTKNQKHNLTELFRTLESYMRESWHFSYKIKCGKTTEMQNVVIKNAIMTVINRKKQAQRICIELDTSLFENIRKSADRTKEMLLVPDEGELAEYAFEKPIQAENADKQKEGEKIEHGLLSPDECEFVKLVLEGKNVDAVLKKSGKKLSMITDEINEKLFDEFSDNVFDFDGEAPIIIEDYEEELKGMICT